MPSVAALDTLLARAGGKSVAVGYDGRVSSPMLEAALVEGFNDSGIDAVRVGMGPTPMLYYAEAVRTWMAASR
jgi:phosphomannomutase